MKEHPFKFLHKNFHGRHQGSKMGHYTPILALAIRQKVCKKLATPAMAPTPPLAGPTVGRFAPPKVHISKIQRE
ncbi:unnamed protein product [Ilex paraguariensis]|uniref:Uncharacterized protein n=1 Tax=Ilex paraguariensis TaxID=185542 RepID=A0ABC8RPF4_9AQUA